MDVADADEDRSIERFRRFEWLLGQITGAAREADAHDRLEAALRRLAALAARTRAPGAA